MKSILSHPYLGYNFEKEKNINSILRKICYLSIIYVSVCLSVLSVYVYFYLFLSLYLYLKISLARSLSESLSLKISLSNYLSLSIDLPTYPYLCIYLSSFNFICLSLTTMDLWSHLSILPLANTLRLGENTENLCSV